MIYAILIIILIVLFNKCIRYYRYECWSHSIVLGVIACIIFWILDIIS